MGKYGMKGRKFVVNRLPGDSLPGSSSQKYSWRKSDKAGPSEECEAFTGQRVQAASGFFVSRQCKRADPLAVSSTLCRCPFPRERFHISEHSNVLRTLLVRPRGESDMAERLGLSCR